MEKIINTLYQNKILSRLFHTTVYCLQKELKECHSVLDLGCGPKSPLTKLRLEYTVGVEVFEPFYKQAKKNNTHNKLMLKDITKINFKPKIFDAVVMIEVLEHLSKQEGKKLLTKVEKWAKKKILLTTPNGFVKQVYMDANPYQIHKSGWSVKEMKKLGYQAYGMAGFKVLSFRGKNLNNNKKAKKGGHKILNQIVSTITDTSQIIAYFIPKMAFRVFYIKNLT